MDTAAIWVGYAVMIVGAFVVCLGALIGAAMVSNKMSHMVLNAYGGWKVFLEFREWYHNERPKVGADEDTAIDEDLTMNASREMPKYECQVRGSE